MSCDPEVVHSMIEKRWKKFAAFKREGENGEIVMSGGRYIVEDVIPGKYKLQELSQFFLSFSLRPTKINAQENCCKGFLGIKQKYNSFRKSNLSSRF